MNLKWLSQNNISNINSKNKKIHTFQLKQIRFFHIDLYDLYHSVTLKKIRKEFLRCRSKIIILII